MKPKPKPFLPDVVYEFGSKLGKTHAKILNTYHNPKSNKALRQIAKAWDDLTSSTSIPK